MDAHHPTRGGRPFVLVVDDEESVLVDVKAYLYTYGFQVDITSDQEEAEALLIAKHYALVIVDLDLTGAHGREGLGLLRVARNDCPLAKRVLLTELSASDLEPAICHDVVDAMLEKPLLLSELASVGMRLLGLPIPQLLGADG